MKEYDVTIEETITQGFKVKANSPEEAEDIAIQKYKNEEFVLTNPTVVEKNILVVAGSTYPDIEKGNLILAGHSGTGWKAFFNDLYKLAVGDQLIVNYKNKVSLKSILFEIEDILSEESLEDLDLVSETISERVYYNNTNK